MSTKLRAIDLFCGIGGNSWGARASGIEIIAGFDKWELAGQVYQDNFPGATFFPGKLQENRLDDLDKKLGKIDLILASPECTSHSVARGNREKNRESLELAYQVLRFTEKLQPRWVVIENVTSMKSWDGYHDFLEKLGKEYKYLEQPLIASDFGVAQSRRRLFILCGRDRQPGPVTLPKQDRPKTVADILVPDGKYRFSPLVTERRAKNTLDRAKRAVDVLGKETPFLLVYYGSDAAGGWQRLDQPLRTITTVDRFALVRPDGKGGHEIRMLQPDELQTAMGFPPDLKLNGTNRRQKIHLLGNAVCPPVMKAIVQTLLGTVEKE